MVYSLFSVVLVNLLVFCSKHKHFLLTLLSLEMIVVSFFVLIFFSFNMSLLFFSLIFISFSACEGALGISILIDMSRSHGSDFIFLLNFSL